MCLLLISVKWWSSCLPLAYRAGLSPILCWQWAAAVQETGQQRFPSPADNSGSFVRHRHEDVLPCSPFPALSSIFGGVLAYASLKDYSTLPKMATSSRSFMTSALGEITEPKIHEPCNPSRLGEGKEGCICFCFPLVKIKGLGCDFLPNILDARFPLMGNENVNYLG